MLCDVADAGHDRCGRGKNEGAGTEDDQYCHGTDDVMGEYIGKNGDGSGSRDDPDSPAIRQSDDFRPSLGAKTPQTRSKSGFAGFFNFFLIGGKLTLSHFPMTRPYLRGTSHARQKSTQCPEASERRVSF